VTDLYQMYSGTRIVETVNSDRESERCLYIWTGWLWFMPTIIMWLILRGWALFVTHLICKNQLKKP